MAELRTSVEKYCRRLLSAGYAAGTVSHYRFHLNRFVSWAEGKQVTYCGELTRRLITSHLEYLHELRCRSGRSMKTGSRNNALQAVKTFCRFLREEGHINGDPAALVAYARAPTRFPRAILTHEEACRILSAPDMESALGFRDRAILEVLYSSGIRKSEATNLLLPDVDSDRGYLRVTRGKGGRCRVVPLGRTACRFVKRYVRTVRPLIASRDAGDHLFVSLRGSKLSKNMIWDIVRKYARKAGIEKPVSPHTFRHSCATEMLKGKASIRHIQELLGHASLTSTQVYLSLTIVELKKVHRRCHPRERYAD